MADNNDKPLMDGALFVDGDAPTNDKPNASSRSGSGRSDSRRNASRRSDSRDDEASKGHPGDGKAEEALEFLDGILAHMDLDTDVAIRTDDEEVVLDISGPDSGRAIGRKGQTLDALQFLVNKHINRSHRGRRHILIDSGDYRERHDEGLCTLAERQAERAIDQGKVVSLQPMTPRDRRVVHNFLAEFEGVSTRSEGEGNNRRIRILPDRN